MKKGYRRGPPLAKQEAGTTCVARCPVVSLPHMQMNLSLRVSTSTIGSKSGNNVLSSTSALSGNSFPPASFVVPLPLPILGDVTAEKGAGDQGK